MFSIHNDSFSIVSYDILYALGVLFIMMDKPVYRETLQLPFWYSIILGLFIVVLTPLIVFQVFTISREPVLLGFFIFFDLFFIFILFNFRTLEVVICQNNISVSFGVIRKKILLKDVLSCEPIKTSLGVYTGNGIRVGGDGSLAFITSFGNAVKLNRIVGRPFVFSTNTQIEILNIIQKLLQ